MGVRRDFGITAATRHADFATLAPPSQSPLRMSHGQRRFDGAVVDRLTTTWQTNNVAIDFELKSDLDRLRARTRDMSKNNEYGKKYMRMVRNNMVGADGFKLQSKAADPNGTTDEQAKKAVEDGFTTWMRAQNCDVAGKRGFIEMCRLKCTGVARDGEFIVRRLRGPQYGPFGYQLQMLDMDRLDTKYNVAGTQTSNAIIMGVELDPVRRPVAYHLWSSPQYPGDLNRYRERVPAAEIFHCFVPEEDEQTRGYTWMHAGMRRANDLNGYREAAVVAARGGATKMGFYVSPDGQMPGDDTDDEGEFLEHASPGEFPVLPVGYDFKEYDPTYPHDQFEAFCKGTLRGISAAWGVSYNGLANDLEGVNFSSMRTGVQDERDEWMVLQNWFIVQFLTPVFEEWLGMALLMGAIKLPNGTPLPAAKLDKFLPHKWQPRRWQWVDPFKDTQTAVMQINNRINSPQNIAAESGRDLEDVLNDIAAFEKMCAQRGIAPQIATPIASANDPAANASSSDGGGNNAPDG